MKQLLYLSLLLSSFQLCHAQSFTVEGSITDTLNNAHLPQASVVLMHAADSVMESHARSDADGKFQLHADSAGKYLIMITFPGFADYVDVVKLTDKSTVDLGEVPMISREHLLKEVVFTQQVAAIKVKGDTTEYMADSFKVKDNATVEELLKRLPGIQVDKDGKIVAQGEKIEKILVDGEEFFSDDPAVVIKGLQAKTLEKVQVYDKKSDQAEFTGIDDGQKTKTLNLQLKDNMKRGYFGKIDAGGGTGGYFEDQAMINMFRGKQQISAFGIMSNTGQVGLGWEDNDKFSSGSGTTVIDDEGQVVTYFSGNDDNDFGGWNGVYSGQGIPTVWTGGLHYANKWDEDKYHVTGNYRGAKQDVEIAENTITQYVLPGDSQYYTTTKQNQFSTAQRHSLNAMYEWKLDSTSSLKVSADAGYRNTQTSSTYDTKSLSAGDALINENTRKITSDATQQYINADVLYRKKFAKKGRSFSLDLKENYKDSHSDGQLNAVSSFYSDSLSNTYTDQRKQNSNNTQAFAAKLTYTEPIAKKEYLELNYGLNVNNSVGANFSYNKLPGTDAYTALDSPYSSNYKYNILTNNGGANLRFVYDKVNFSFGADVADSRYKQTDLLHGDTSYRYDYFNLFPKAAFNYKFNRQRSLSLTYNGSTRQPTIEQIQPLRQNTDPLNIAIGNPALRQEFRNTISARYNDYKVLTGRYLWASASFNFSNDAISQATNVDSLGRRTYQYINVNGNYNGWGYLGYGFHIKKLDMDAGFDLNPGINHINNYVNGVKNVSDFNTYSFGINFNRYKDKKYSVYFTPGVTYNDNHATVSQYATSYWESNNELTVSVFLPLKFEVSTTLNYKLRQRTTIFDRNNDVLLWNAFVSKKFLKKDQLELKVFVYDILNQNIGYSRFAQDNYITENDYNTFTRHGMISLVWNFTKTLGGAADQPASNIMIK